MAATRGRAGGSSPDRRPRASTFVVKPAPSGEASSPGDGEPLLVTQEGEARSGWERLLEEYRDAAWIAPVQADASGATSIPTGEVTVRFHDAPTDEAVAALARRHGAQVARRAEFQPRQVVIVPDDPRATFLPELCEQLESEADVERAWPNTVSRYRRA